MQGAWALYSTELQDLAPCSEIVAEIHNKTASGFSRHMLFERVLVEIPVLCEYKELVCVVKLLRLLRTADRGCSFRKTYVHFS